MQIFSCGLLGLFKILSTYRLGRSRRRRIYGAGYNCLSLRRGVHGLRRGNRFTTAGAKEQKSED